MGFLPIWPQPVPYLHLQKETERDFYTDKSVSGNLTEITEKILIYSEISIVKREMAKYIWLLEQILNALHSQSLPCQNPGRSIT